MDVRPCSNWEKQYKQNQKLLNKKVPDLIKGPSLPVLKEMPSMEERSNVSPLRSKRATFLKVSQYTDGKDGHQDEGEKDAQHNSRELEGEEVFLSPGREIESEEGNLQVLPTKRGPNGVVETARDDQEFVVRLPKKKKLTVEIKRMPGHVDDVVLQLEASNSRPKPSEQKMQHISPQFLNNF